MGRGDADDAHARGAGGLHAGVRVLEDDAIDGRHFEEMSGAQVDIGEGLGTANLMPVNDGAKIPGEPGFFEDEMDVGGLGVAGEGHGNGAMALEERAESGGEVTLDAAGDGFAEETLLGRAARGDLGIRQIPPKKPRTISSLRLPYMNCSMASVVSNP